MKRILLLLSAVVLLTECYKDDISDLRDEIERFKERMALYESLLDAFNNRLYVVGYTDNFPNNDPRTQIDIDRAVDKNGKPVRLKGIDFVKVYTEGGWSGEISTEVSGFTDLNL